jgi:hypothetical protein
VRKDHVVFRAVAFSEIGRRRCGPDLSLCKMVTVDN